MATISELLAQYRDAEKELHQTLGYEGAWREYPIRDETDMFWGVTDGGLLRTAYAAADLNGDGSRYYEDEIIWNQSTHPDYTAMVIDTHTDGNKYFIILDDSKLCDIPEE